MKANICKECGTRFILPWSAVICPVCVYARNAKLIGEEG